MRFISFKGNVTVNINSNNTKEVRNYSEKKRWKILNWIAELIPIAIAFTILLIMTV